MISYTLKQASGAVYLGDNWNAGQWKQANILELNNYRGDRPEHFPKTKAKLLYDDANLYVFFRVEDRYVRAIADRSNGRVWEDSCVEFFFAPNAEFESIYFNLETNCGGTMLFLYNNKKNNAKRHIEQADCKKIEVYHSLPGIISEEIVEPTKWTLSYKLPFAVIKKYCHNAKKPRTGVKWRANFYKCADKTSHPHWLTCPFVDNLMLYFHLPQYFGRLDFE